MPSIPGSSENNIALFWPHSFQSSFSLRLITDLVDVSLLKSPSDRRTNLIFGTNFHAFTFIWLHLNRINVIPIICIVEVYKITQNTLLTA